MAGFTNGFQRSADIGIVASSLLLDFRQGGQRHVGMEVVGKNEIVVEVRENQHGQVEPGIEEGQLCLLKLAPPVAHLELGFDDIGVSDLAAVLEILCEFQKFLALGGGFLGEVQPALRCQNTKVALDDGDYQAARGDFGSSARCRGRRGGPAKASNAGKIEGFVDVSLAYIFMHRVVRDVADGCAWSVALGVENFVAVADRRQKSVASLGTVFMSQGRIGQGALKHGTVFSRAGQGVVERKRERRGLRGGRVRIRTGRSARRQRESKLLRPQWSGKEGEQHPCQKKRAANGIYLH